MNSEEFNKTIKPLVDKWADDLVKDGLVNEHGTITMSEWSNLQGDFYINNDNPIYNNVIDVTPNYTIRFFNKDQKEVGNFDFNGDKLKFEGDVEESAEVFINFLLNCFHKRIEEIKSFTIKEYDEQFDPRED